MRYCYKIKWTSDADSELHTTYVECKRRNLSSAEVAFDKFFHKFLFRFIKFSYTIVECEYLGEVIKQCW